MQELPITADAHESAASINHAATTICFSPAEILKSLKNHTPGAVVAHQINHLHESLGEEVCHTLPKAIRKRLYDLIHTSRKINNVDAKEQLLKDAFSISLASLTVEFNYEKSSTVARLTQFLVVELHRNSLEAESAELLNRALERQYVFNPSTIFSTLYRLGEKIQTPGDARKLGSLATTSVKLLAPTASADTLPALVETTNIVLARISAPACMTEESNPNLLVDENIVDTFERLTCAASLTCEALEQNLPFSSPNSESRYSQVLRSLSTAALGLVSLHRKIRLHAKTDSLSRRQIRLINREIGLPVDYPLWQAAQHKVDYLYLSRSLTLHALNITAEVIKRHTRAPDVNQYKLSGKTISLLLHAVHYSHYDLDPSERRMLVSIIDSALQDSFMKKRLHSRSLAPIIKSLARRESFEDKQSAVSLLTCSLQTGHAFEPAYIKEIIRLTYPKTHRQKRKEFDYLQNLLVQPQRTATKPLTTTQATQDLKGGLDGKQGGKYFKDFFTFLGLATQEKERI